MLSIHRKVQRVQCFTTDAAQFGALAQRYAGIHAIPVDAIVGSVGRSHELRSDFLPLTAVWGYPRGDARYHRVLEAMKQDVPLPAIEVYKLGDRYYVLDGNHRVAAAIATGHISIDAVVVEFIPVSIPAPCAAA